MYLFCFSRFTFHIFRLDLHSACLPPVQIATCTELESKILLTMTILAVTSTKGQNSHLDIPCPAKYAIKTTSPPLHCHHPLLHSPRLEQYSTKVFLEVLYRFRNTRRHSTAWRTLPLPPPPQSTSSYTPSRYSTAFKTPLKVFQGTASTSLRPPTHSTLLYARVCPEPQ